MKRKFLRQDTNKEKCLRKVWRNPTGRHSKLRLKKAGHRKKPSIGFGKPKDQKHLHPSGFKFVIVNNPQELSKLKVKAILLSSALGLRKKLEVLKIAKEMNLKVLNIKNVDEFIKKSQELISSRKKEKEHKQTKKTKSKEESLKRAEKNKEKKDSEEKKVKALPEEMQKMQRDVLKKESKQVVRAATAPQQK